MRRLSETFCILALTCSAVTAQVTQPAFFVTTIGNDTLAIESYQIDASGVHGTSVTKVPRTSVRTYSLSLTPSGLPDTFTFTSGPPGGDVQLRRVFHYTDDSVIVEVTQNGSTKSSSVKVSGRPYPFFVDVFGIWSYALHHALADGGSRSLLFLSGTRTLPYDITGNAPGKLELSNPNNSFGPLYATVGQGNMLETFDMTPTTDKFIVARIDQLDLDATERSFLAHEQTGQAAGVLSPRDTARASFGGATILVDYGRPSMRGRKIFGTVVPWNVVWRLGANAATQLVFDKPMTIGGTPVAPGTYSLFALPGQREWKLIINRQHGQWGTVYDQSNDLVRVPLKTQRVGKPIERFTFHVSGHGKHGALWFEWEHARESVPIAVR